MRNTASLVRITDPLLSDVNNRYIGEINLDPLRGLIRVRLVMSSRRNDAIFLTLGKVAHVSTSCNPNDIDDLRGLAFIADLSLYSFTDGGASILSKLHYPILDLEGRVRTYPGTLHLYLHVEGDICIDVVCASYGVSQS